MDMDLEDSAILSSDEEDFQRLVDKDSVDLLPLEEKYMKVVAPSTERLISKSPFSFHRRIDDNTTHLNLAYYGLGQRGVQLLLSILREKSFLKDLDISKNGLSDKQLSRIIDTVLNQSTITSLNLSGNALGESSIYSLATGLQLHCSIECLNLSETKLNDRTFEKMLSFGLTKNSSLQKIDLSRNSLGDWESNCTGVYLRSSKIKKADLSWNQLRGKAVSIVITAISMVPYLEDLNLARNGITDSHMPGLEKALTKSLTLTNLDLSGNRISDSGAKIMALGIQNNSSLKYISLGGNPILTFGAHFIITSLLTRSIGLMYFLDLSTTAIDQSLLDALTLYQMIHPAFTYKVGTLSQGKVVVPEIRLSTVQIFDRCLQARNLRILDVFRRIDRTNSQEITRNQFVKGIIKQRLPFRKHQAYELFDEIDTEKQGAITYGQIHKKIRESRGNNAKGRGDAGLTSDRSRIQKGEMSCLTQEEYDPSTNEIVEGKPLSLSLSNGLYPDINRTLPNSFQSVSNMLRRGSVASTSSSVRDRRFSIAEPIPIQRQRANSVAMDWTLALQFVKKSNQSSPLPVISSLTASPLGSDKTKW